MKLFIDYDSTLNNMVYAWVKWLNDTYGTAYTIEDVTYWDWFNDIEQNAFKFFHGGLAFKLITPLDGSQEFFTHITDRYETHILTSSSDIMKPHKDKHIKEFYGETSVIHHTDKWEYAVHPDKTCILIDDRPLNCEKFAEEGGIAFLFNHEGRYEYTLSSKQHENLHVVTDYHQIKRHLEKINDKINAIRL